MTSDTDEVQIPKTIAEAIALKKKTEHKNTATMSWIEYHDLTTIYNYLDDLEKNYLNICKIFPIGKTSNGKILRVLRITENVNNKRTIWIDGGIHAREWISPATVTNIIDNLVRNWSNQPDHVRTATWYILPMVNPDGYAYSRTTDRMWRKNRRQFEDECYGVDLNRNFSYHWGEAGASDDPYDTTFRGPQAFSELETKAIRNFLIALPTKPTVFLTFHSYSQVIWIPFTYSHSPNPDNYSELLRIAEDGAKSMENANGEKYEIRNKDKLLSGTSVDWAKAILKSELTFIIELRDRGEYGFKLPPKFILDVASESFAFVMKISEEAAKIR